MASIFVCLNGPPLCNAFKKFLISYIHVVLCCVVLLLQQESEMKNNFGYRV